MALPLAPIIGGGMTLLGGLFGSKGQRPMLDPEELKRLFGANAVSGETRDLYNLLSHSPAFSAMMRSAGLQGARASNRTASALASRGLSSTPYGSFLGAASRGYGRGMQLQGQQDLFLKALQAALSNVQGRQNAYVSSFLQQQQTPSFMSQLGSSLLAGGSQGLLGWMQGQGGGGGGGGSVNLQDPFGLLKGLG